MDNINIEGNRNARRLIFTGRCMSARAATVIAVLSTSIFAGTALAVRTKADIDDETLKLKNQVSVLTASQAAAFAHLKDETNLSQGVLLVGFVCAAHAGDTFDWPVTIVPGSFSPASLQADIIIPAGFTLVSVIAGPAATAAGKSAQTSVVSGAQRIIVFGLNQTSIGEGVVAVLRLKVAATATKRQYPFILSGPIASSAAGQSLLMSTISGTVVVQ